MSAMFGHNPRTDVEPPAGKQADPVAHLFHAHRQYIRGLSKSDDRESLISAAVAESALRIWSQLNDWMDDDLAVPDAAPGLNGELVQIWKSRDHYLSLRVGPEEELEFFYRNIKTGQIWCEGYPLELTDLPEEVRDRLAFFSRRG